MQKARPKTKKRGRPPKFDHDQVVEAAIGAFFRKGFEATTLDDLEASTGVDRSTLYNSFGGKAGLYRSAIGTYLSLAETGLFHPLLVGTDDGYADILEFLVNLRTGLISPDAIPGCLIVNDMAAGTDPGAAARYRTMLEDGLRAALARAGDPDPERRSHRARLVTTSVIGINLVSKATGDPDEIGVHVDALVDLVSDWASEGAAEGHG
ncbi:MAG: TetR/AcrR family transcriptional regulator [Actinomycetota bacterium]